MDIYVDIRHVITYALLSQDYQQDLLLEIG